MFAFSYFRIFAFLTIAFSNFSCFCYANGRLISLLSAQTLLKCSLNIILLCVGDVHVWVKYLSKGVGGF